MCSRNIVVCPAGVLLCLVVLLYDLKLAVSQPPQLDTNRDVQDLTEGDVLRLTCTFTFGGQRVTFGEDSTPLPSDVNRVKVAGLDDVYAVFKGVGSQTQFAIEFTVSRKHDHLAVTFSQTFIINGTRLSPNVTRTLRVKYGPLRNISDSTAICVNISGSSADESKLDASGLFEDPGNPTSTVQWTWDTDNGLPVTGTISGNLDSMLRQRVTRGDDGRVIVARYDNGIGYTMQRFTICANSVPGSPPTQCFRVATGYSCSWSLPADDGGYSVTHYDYGYMKGISTIIQDLTRVPESTISTINANLEPGTAYTFVVSAVNALSSGPRGSDSVVTPSPPGEVVDVETMPLSRFSLKVKWNPPEGEDKEFHVTQYRVSLYAGIEASHATQAVKTKLLNGTMNEAMFFGLKDNTTYQFRVAAENAVGIGPYSNYVLGTTFPNGTVGVVSVISVSEESAESFLVEWTSADAGGTDFEITGYRVEILLDGMVVQNVDIPGKEQMSRVFSNLLPERSYEIRVYARNRQGEGRPSSVVSATTTTKAEEKDENIGPIVGGVIGGIVVVVILGIIIAFIYYKKKPDVSEKETSEKPRSTPKTMHTENPSSEPPPTGEYALLGAAIPEANKPGGKQPGQVTYAQLDLEKGTDKSKSLKPKSQELTTYADIQHAK